MAMLRPVGELERLDFRGGIDPGGFHWVEYHELPGGDVLIVFEVGLARINSAGRLLWQRVHDDITARLQRIDPDAVWLKGEGEAFGFRLSDGCPILF
jgi:hypothetical protein